MTLATAFAQTRIEFIWLQVLARVFGYCEEMLCVVVIAEEIDARVRGWATGTLGAMWALGGGLVSGVFAAVTILPYGWRAMYFIGGAVLMTLAYYRRWLPETRRFEIRREEVAAMGSKLRAGADTLRRLIGEYPGRLAAMMTALFAFGLATGPASVLMSKYLQTTHHYAPHQVGMLYIFGGLIALVGNIAAGRISDRIGRKTVVATAMVAAGGGFALFFSGYDGMFLPVLWIVALFGYLSTDALLAGYAVEIFPTAYRATLGGLRYVFVILGGALGLALEGIFYDWFGAHGPAISVSLAILPVGLVALLLLPEPARRVLEEIAPASAE
jgi:putative MFS transporter